MSELFHTMVDSIVELVGSLGYMGIFLLMSLESSFVPFPSEVVLIPAGVLVRAGKMSALGVLLAGVLGSLLGAYINYFIARTVGRKFILKFGRYFLLSEEKFLKVEQAFLAHGKFATFVGRLIFGIRQWISIPAGLSKMPLLSFSLLTALGAGIWVAILMSLGMAFGDGEETVLVAKRVGLWLVGVVAILGAAYYAWWVPRKHRSASNLCA